MRFFWRVFWVVFGIMFFLGGIFIMFIGNRISASNWKEVKTRDFD